MTDFERQVLSDLSELKAQMHALIGNGQPGRIKELELRVQQHERYVQRAGGVSLTMVVLFALLRLMLHLLRIS
jgi:hypothetical protein